MADLVRDEIADMHKTTGISSSLEAELEHDQNLPHPDLAKQIILEQDGRARQPTRTVTRRADNLDPKV